MKSNGPTTERDGRLDHCAHSSAALLRKGTCATNGYPWRDDFDRLPVARQSPLVRYSCRRISNGSV